MARIDNAIYDRIHATWWDEDGFMALLRTAVNPPRFDYFREVLVDRLHLQPEGMRLLDVGCGGGLLAERFAGLGCAVTGIDLSAPSLAAAREHARRGGLAIEYVQGGAERLPFAASTFDAACCCDVLEHVDDPGAVLSDIARVLRPGGVLFFDTINRTARSWLLAIKLAQDWWPTRMMPRDVHVWDKFIRPAELTAALAREGLHSREVTGLSPPMRPLRAANALLQKRLGRIGFAELGERLALRRGSDLSVSYMGYAIRAT